MVRHLSSILHLYPQNTHKFTHEWDKRQPTTCFTEMKGKAQKKKTSLHQSHAPAYFLLFRTQDTNDK